MAVKWNERSVVFICVRRTLLEIKRVNRKPLLTGFLRGLSAGKTPQLEKLPAIFLAVGFAGEQRVKKIIFARFNGWIGVTGKKWRERPSFFRIFLLIVEQRPDGLGALAGIQRQRKLIIKQSGMERI